MKESGKRMKNTGQLKIQSKCWCILFILLSVASHSNAQTTDSTYTDSTIVDTSVAASAQSESHIYDTSQNFFNWKEDLNQPYSQNKISSRIHADKEVNELKNEDDFWYVKSIEKFKSSPQQVIFDKAKDSVGKKGKGDIDPRQFSEEERYQFNLPPWVSTLIWSIIIAVFLFAVAYFLLANKINIFSRSKAGNGTAADTGSEELDLFKLPYQDLLQKAYTERNYRLAVRILYLQTLKLLSEKNIIAFQAEYTNMDYLQQLSHTMFYKDFFAITRHYEYVWYGGFTVAEPAFSVIRNDFTTIQDKILHQ